LFSGGPVPVPSSFPVSLPRRGHRQPYQNKLREGEKFKKTELREAKRERERGEDRGTEGETLVILSSSSSSSSSGRKKRIFIPMMNRDL
jgi:hypothetical protein